MFINRLRCGILCEAQDLLLAANCRSLAPLDMTTITTVLKQCGWQQCWVMRA